MRDINTYEVVHQNRVYRYLGRAEVCAMDWARRNLPKDAKVRKLSEKPLQEYIVREMDDIEIKLS